VLVAFESLYAQTAGDTIYSNKNNGIDQLVFIDKPHSKYHDMVFELLLSDTNSFDGEKKMRYSQDSSSINFSGQWITIKKYKGKFYAYFPSEPFYNTFMQIGDSNLVINDFNEGFVSFPVAHKKESRKKIKISLNESSGGKHSLLIKKKKKNLFVVRSSLFNVRKLRFVKRTAYADFPIIVNYCPVNRCPEFAAFSLSQPLIR
jgi:hypothetical protein